MEGVAVDALCAGVAGESAGLAVGDGAGEGGGDEGEEENHSREFEHHLKYTQNCSLLYKYKFSLEL